MAPGFNTTGIGLSAILMVVCAVLVVFSSYLIGGTRERSPYRSWESAGFGILFPRTDYIVAGVMISLQLGTMVGFVTAVSDLLVPFSAAQRANRCLWTEYRLGDAALRLRGARVAGRQCCHCACRVAWHRCASSRLSV